MNLSNLRVEQLKPNQLIITDSLTGSRAFYSYSSFIAQTFPNKPTILGADWDYSKTTSKYRNQFLNETTSETRAKLQSGEYRLAT